MNVTTIIPIHDFNDDINNFLIKSIESIIKQKEIEYLPKLILIFPQNIEDKVKNTVKEIKDLKNVDTTYIVNTQNSDYQSQINFAIKSVETKFFSVLEFDDEYSPTYLKNVDKYITSYTKVDIFMPMIIEVNEKNEGIKMTNETVWAQQFVGENGEMGYLNINGLKQYTDFKLSGAAINKSKFIELGMYKTKIKLTFMYEFLLRALNNGVKIMTIPKICYKHLIERKDSLFSHYHNSMAIKERKFWFETANKESNFTKDRDIDLSLLDDK